MQLNHRWTQMNTDQQRPQITDRETTSLAAPSPVIGLFLFRICVHLCPSVVKAFFDRLGKAKSA